jgi:hypothetical protein
MTKFLLNVGGALGMWGDMIVKFADNSDNISGSLGEIPAIGAVAPLLNRRDSKHYPAFFNKV